MSDSAVKNSSSQEELIDACEPRRPELRLEANTSGPLSRFFLQASMI